VPMPRREVADPALDSAAMTTSTTLPSKPETGPRWRRALTRGVTRNVVALGFVSLFTDVSSEMLVYLIPLYLANVLLAPAAVIGLIEGLAESTASVLKLVSGALSIGCRGAGCWWYRLRTSVAAKVLYLAAVAWPIVLLGRSAIESARGSGRRRVTL